LILKDFRLAKPSFVTFLPLTVPELCQNSYIPRQAVPLNQASRSRGGRVWKEPLAAAATSFANTF
jgi:hypothetical protein